MLLSFQLVHCLVHRRGVGTFEKKRSAIHQEGEDQPSGRRVHRPSERRGSAIRKKSSPIVAKGGAEEKEEVVESREETNVLWKGVEGQRVVEEVVEESVTAGCLRKDVEGPSGCGSPVDAGDGRAIRPVTPLPKIAQAQAGILMDRP